MKIYNVEITTAEKPYKHVVQLTAENELDAIDKAHEHYTIDLDKEIVDIKVI